MSLMRPRPPAGTARMAPHTARIATHGADHRAAECRCTTHAWDGPSVSTPLLSTALVRRPHSSCHACGHGAVTSSASYHRFRSPEQERWGARRTGSGHLDGQAEMTQNAPDHLRVFDERDQFEAVPAPRTRQHVEPETPLHQFGPEPVRARRDGRSGAR